MGLVNLNNNTSFYNFSDNPFAISSKAYSPIALISAAKNGYSGFEFSAVNMGLLVNASVQGMFDYGSSAWDWYFQNGALTAGSVPWARLTNVPAASASQAGLISREAGGVWTPTIRGASAAGTPTYGARKGTWSRIGSEIRAFFQVSLSALSGASGNLIITGLPFYVQPDGYELGSVLIKSYSGISLQSGFTQLTAGVNQVAGITGECINFYRCGSGQSFAPLQTNQIAAPFWVEGVAIYETYDE